MSIEIDFSKMDKVLYTVSYVKLDTNGYGYTETEAIAPRRFENPEWIRPYTHYLEILAEQSCYKRPGANLGKSLSYEESEIVLLLMEILVNKDPNISYYWKIRQRLPKISK